MLTSRFSYAFDAEVRTKEFLGSRPKACKFCPTAGPPPTFKKAAHVIPAGLGNRTLFSNEECDGCNEWASALENDLVNMLAVVRAMARARARKGSPKYRLPNKKSFIESDAEANMVTISRSIDENVIDVRHAGPGYFEMLISPPAFRPLNAAKALARMALLVMPRDVFNANAHLLRWIRGEENWYPQFHRAFVPGTGLSTTGLELFHDPDARLHLITFWFSTTILLMRLPTLPWELPDQIMLPSLPNSPYPPHEPSVTTYRIVADHVLRPGPETVGVRYRALHDVLRWAGVGVPRSRP